MFQKLYTVFLNHIYFEFIQKDPISWENDTFFISDRENAGCRMAVNDLAEQSIALMQDFNPVLTKQEKQKQYLQQITEMHSREIAQSNIFT